MDTTALSEEEKNHLLTIYRSRRQFFWIVFISLFVVAALFSPRINRRDRHTGEVHQWSEKNDGEGTVSPMQMVSINFVFLETMVIAVAVNVYRKRIRPYKKDIDNGVKEMVPYIVTRKTYFSTTGQYFISFDDPNYMHHEVDAQFYNNINEGDTAFVARAPLSNYVFDMNGRFTIL